MPLLSEQTIRRWDRVIRWVESNLMRRNQVPDALPRRGTGDPCRPLITLQFWIWGNPNGGEFDLTFRFEDENGAPIDDTFTLPYNATGAQMLAELLEHPAITDPAWISVGGGPLPSSAILVEIKGKLKNRIPAGYEIPTADLSATVGGVFPVLHITRWWR